MSRLLDFFATVVNRAQFVRTGESTHTTSYEVGSVNVNVVGSVNSLPQPAIPGVDANTLGTPPVSKWAVWVALSTLLLPIFIIIFNVIIHNF